MKPKCLYCGERNAKQLNLPLTERGFVFCTLKCAARYAIGDAMRNYELCEVHGEWVFDSDQCTQCVAEGHVR